MTRLLFFITLVVSFGCTSVAEPAYIIPPEVESGQIFSAGAVGTDITRLTIEIQDINGGYVVSADGFRYEVGDGYEVWLALAGVPSDVKSGTYHVFIETEDDKGIWQRTRTTEIHLPAYPQEEIDLSDEMSTLRTSADDRKAEEWRILKSIYATTNPASMYHIGPLILPVASVIVSSEYGVRRRFLYHNGGEGFSIHNGIDFAIPVGTPILACGSGTVVLSTNRILSGFSIVIEHMPGVYSTYYHMSRLNAHVGDYVQVGDVIGASGATGLVTGPHLHWEVRVSGIPISPVVQTGRPMIDKGDISSIIELFKSTEGR